MIFISLIITSYIYTMIGDKNSSQGIFRYRMSKSLKQDPALVHLDTLLLINVLSTVRGCN